MPKHLKRLQRAIARRKALIEARIEQAIAWKARLRLLKRVKVTPTPGVYADVPYVRQRHWWMASCSATPDGVLYSVRCYHCGMDLNDYMRWKHGLERYQPTCFPRPGWDREPVPC
jgi:hypothetical protein